MAVSNDVKVISKFPAGLVTVPPSKSQAHRVIICALLSNGESRIDNIAFSRDILATLNAVSALGARWQRLGDSSVKIEGVGRLSEVSLRENGLCPPDFLRVHCGDSHAPCIDCDESGSTLRFMLPVAAALGASAVFTGKGRLMERPIDQYERVFAQNGAVLHRASNGLSFRGCLRPGTYSLDGKVSSQFVSGLLFALPLLDGDSEIVVENGLESAAYVDMTMDVCESFAVHSNTEEYRKFYIPGRQAYCPSTFQIEGDYSQAAYFLAAGALGADVACAALSPKSLQADRAILNILRQMGATITNTPDGVHKVSATKLRAVEVDVSQTPDIAPPLAALMCFAEGQSRMTGAARLRLKESDRLSAIANVLGGLGADIREHGDSLVINGKPSIRGGAADAHNDHRIAMMAALTALKCENRVTLSGWKCVDKSYPGFWRDWEGQ